ncbi:MAG: hypothetical protein U0936_24105 [Planctomycetaceae bacterium]
MLSSRPLEPWPSEYEQTDEGDLMPYPVLDHIERLAIRDKLSPAEVLETLLRESAKQSPTQYSSAQLSEWVRRFFTLWSRKPVETGTICSIVSCGRQKS